MAASESPAPKRQWSSRAAFLMAAVGAAVGLGNLWRFPFQAGANGGSAFVLVYLLCIIVVVYPAMMGELAVGRRKGLSAVGSTRELAKDAGRSPAWGIVGPRRRPAPVISFSPPMLLSPAKFWPTH